MSTRLGKAARNAAGFALVAAIAIGGPTMPAMAVDTPVETGSPELTSVRAKVKAKDFVGAIEELTPMLQTHQHADVYNLLGFSFRKTGKMDLAATYYGKALDFDPDHKGALEYQGEMFVEQGRLDRARANLDRLVKLCPTGCEEREDLEKAIADATRPKR